MKGKKTLIAKVVAVKGLQGEVKLKVFTADPLKIKTYTLLLENNISIQIKSCYVKNNVLIAKIEGIDTREQAEKLILNNIYANTEQWDPLLSDEFYHVDLIDLNVLSTTKELLGKVVAVHNFGAGDILEIQFINSKLTEMLRFTEVFFPEINIIEGYIVLDQPVYM